MTNREQAPPRVQGFLGLRETTLYKGHTQNSTGRGIRADLPVCKGIPIILIFLYYYATLSTEKTRIDVHKNHVFVYSTHLRRKRMTFDVCFVTYNSKKWLANCLASFAAVHYDKTKIRLYFADNASTDDTVSCLKEFQTHYTDTFGAFEVMETGANLGFGAGSNHAAQAGRGDYVFFCNVDTEIHTDAFTHLEHAIEQNKDFSAFELRQFPYEHPKFYNPLTLEVSYASGACFVLSRPIFQLLGGFDESIFMYAEDVDLSWRVRLMGHKIRYVPAAIVHHYAYQSPGEQKAIQLAGNAVGSYILRAKFGCKDDVIHWNDYFSKTKASLQENTEVWQAYEAMMQKAKVNHKNYRHYYKTQVKHTSFTPTFLGFDFSFARSGAFYENRLPNIQPFFSVLVRSYQRPQLLRTCLQALTLQSYPHFEVVVCEDGQTPTAQEVTNEFKDQLRIRYHAMNRNAGRCLTGNRAIELATGDYLNFLDDDDYLFPEHLEVLACQIERHPKAAMFTLGSVVMEMDSTLQSTLDFAPSYLQNMGRESITLADIFSNNQMPIQAVAFHKSLPTTAGMFDDMFRDGYEDWELWARYMMHTENVVLNKATSCYRVPTKGNFKNSRNTSLLNNMSILRTKFSTYTLTVSADTLLNICNSPKTIASETTEHQEHLALQKLYAEVVASTSWKRSNALRRFGNIIASGISNCCNKLYGPPSPNNPEFADDKDMNTFIKQTRTSLFWRFVQWLSHRRTS